jgi:cytochrome c-type biogenesis protein CcmE
MTVPRFGRRRPIAALALIIGIAAAILVTAGLQDTVVYYRTPTEVMRSGPDTHRTVRLGGQVMFGSVAREGDTTRFRLTDGQTNLPVVAQGALPGTFAEGRGAVVEGSLDPDGTFVGHDLAVKHSNEYRPPTRRAALGAPR